MSLPLPVTRKCFLAPECVLFFGISGFLFSAAGRMPGAADPTRSAGGAVMAVRPWSYEASAGRAPRESLRVPLAACFSARR